MHILLIPSWYSTDRNPTRGIFFFAQAQALQRAGHQVGMLIPPSRFRTLNGLQELRRYWRRKNTDIRVSNQHGIAFYRIPWWGPLPSILPWQRGALGLSVFERYVQEQGKPDVIHGHGILYGGYLAAYIGRQHKIPSIVTEHNSMFLRHLVQPGQMPFVRYTMRHVDKMLAVSKALAQALQPLNAGQPIDVVGNVVDTDFFSLPPDLIPDQPFVITSVGRLDTNKSQDILLRAFASQFKGTDARLNIVGAGPKHLDFVKLSHSLEISSQVQFWGQQLPDNVREIVQHSHVIVSTSKIETFGVSLIEAMSCGKPVIATRSGGTEAFVDDINGVLIDIGDVEGLADALLHIQQNYHRYDPQRIREMCMNRFSEAAITQQLESMYTHVCRT